MNLLTILSCAQSVARQQLSAFGYVDAEVQSLIDEVESLLVPDSVVEEVVEEAAPVVEEEAAPAVEEAPAETSAQE
jgi:predicted urease superfamily metal-dependent hydrolase